MKRFFCLLVLSISVFNCALADDQHPGIVANLVVRSGNDWTGSPLPPYLRSDPQIAVMKFIIPPNTSLPVHKHPAINAAYVIDGELTVVQEGGIQRTFKKGEVVIVMVDQWHHGMNQGSVPVELVVFYATTKDLPLAIKK